MATRRANGALEPSQTAGATPCSTQATRSRPSPPHSRRPSGGSCGSVGRTPGGWPSRVSSPINPRFRSPRRATWIPGRLPVSGLRTLVPTSLALWPAPRTYTGQALAEIHSVGSFPIIQAVLSDCLVHGAGLAEPGEFTLRAFLAGRIDLTQAEAVLGVIDARHPAQLQAALQQLAGGLSHPIRVLRERLLDLVAHLEAHARLRRGARRRCLRASGPRRRAGGKDRLAGRPREPVRGARPARAAADVVLAGRRTSERAGCSMRSWAMVAHSWPTRREPRATTWRLLASDGLVIELVDTAVQGPRPSKTRSKPQCAAAPGDQMAAADLILDCLSGEVIGAQPPQSLHRPRPFAPGLDQGRRLPAGAG